MIFHTSNMRTHQCAKSQSVSARTLPHTSQEPVAPRPVTIQNPQTVSDFYRFSLKHTQNFGETKMVWTACSEVCPSLQQLAPLVLL